MIQPIQFNDTADPISVVQQLIQSQLQRQKMTLSVPESLVPRQRPRPAITYNTINHFRPRGSSLGSHQEGGGVMLVEVGGMLVEGGGRGENNSNHATQYSLNQSQSQPQRRAFTRASTVGGRAEESGYFVHRFGGALTKLSD